MLYIQYFHFIYILVDGAFKLGTFTSSGSVAGYTKTIAVSYRSVWTFPLVLLLNIKLDNISV